MLLDEYIEEHCSEEPQYLREIWRETNVRELNGRMVCGRTEGRLLAMLSKLVRPGRILELGTFTGYSALCLAEGLTEDGVLDTVEIDDELEDVIRKNLGRSPLGEKVRVHIESAEEFLCSLKFKVESLKKSSSSEVESLMYDLVFLDADKRRYVEDLELVLPLVRKGGLIVADNTLWSDKVLEENEKGKRKNDQQLEGIIKFNELVSKDERVECVQIPLRDGICFLRKK